MRTALIIIDMQRSLLAGGTWEPEASASTGCAPWKAAAPRAVGAPVFYVADSRVEPHAELHARLSPQECGRGFTKANCNSFLGTSLQADLAAGGITRLVVAGLHTDFCIDTTCRRAASLGYQVTLVADAHSTFDRDYISAAKVVEHHNRILGGLHGRRRPCLGRPLGSGRASR